MGINEQAESRAYFNTKFKDEEPREGIYYLE
jgi:hypothetical protein